MKFKVGDLIYYNDRYVISSQKRKRPGRITHDGREAGEWYIVLESEECRGYVSEDKLTLRMLHNRNGANEVASLQGANG